MQWQPVIGLEVHVQLSTQSKLFSGASVSYGGEPNTQACIIDLGMPGVLPVLNDEAVRMAVKFGLSIKAEIAKTSIFVRKHYFYPDLPKGYQISQYELPIVKNGYLDIQLEDGTEKRINIVRAHLEEDAGKSLHEDFHGLTGIDLNRAGTPLIEIVSAPDMSSAKQAVTCLKALHSLVRYLDISDANMQEGSFRCDANVSVRPEGQPKFGIRTEVKNINSFRFVERAINYEIKRQINVLESGGEVIQETRLYDAGKDETYSTRVKEEAEDYRYFPDPDLLPLKFGDEFIESIRASLPELPNEKRRRLQKEYNLSSYEANILAGDRNMANYFEDTIKYSDANPKLVTSWILGELSAALNKEKCNILNSKVSAEQLASLLRRVTDNTISGTIAKTVFDAMWHGEGEADQIIEQRSLKQIVDSSELEKVIAQIITANPEQLQQYRAGKEKLFGFFVGQVMQATKGKANPQQVNQILKEKLR
ncbi:MAG: glutamyl-tRNA amidotransferase [Coxiella sp. DG_40]|nr:MAG: glutamyl-tRNA amidotransferase [Coxiella sp. DG_40]